MQCVCDWSFEENKYLDEHMKIHSDELMLWEKVQMEIKCANSHQNKAPRFGQKER